MEPGERTHHTEERLEKKKMCDHQFTWHRNFKQILTKRTSEPKPSAHLIYCCLLCQIVSHSLARASQRWQTPDRVKVIHPTAVAAVRLKKKKKK